MGAGTGIARSSSSVNSRYDPGKQNVEYELKLECRAHIWQIEHSAAATATFAIPLQHAMSKYCRGSSLGHILHTDTHDTQPTAPILRTGACLPLCRGGMGEALWIRRGPASPGVRNNPDASSRSAKHREPASPPAPPSAHSQTLAFHYVF